jgi:hypothetical protein
VQPRGPGSDDEIILDLCDDRWRAVVVRRGSWDVTDRPPVMFTRSNSMRPLPEPARGGKLTDLRAFLNLKSHDDWLLVAAWLAAAIRPSGPYPVLHPRGEQGTAKTTFGKMLRRLFDPNLELQPVVLAERRPVPRMADFAVFGEAVARALGEPPGRFLEVLRAARAGTGQDALEGSAVARTFLDWIRQRRTFTGTYTELLGHLSDAVAGRKPANWPRTAQALSGLIRRITPSLRRLGVTIAHAKVGHARTRIVTVTYDPVAARGPSSAPPAGTNGPLVPRL